jgi:hypothetical protein
MEKCKRCFKQLELVNNTLRGLYLFENVFFLDLSFQDLSFQRGWNFLCWSLKLNHYSLRNILKNAPSWNILMDDNYFVKFSKRNRSIFSNKHGWYMEICSKFVGLNHWYYCHSAPLAWAARCTMGGACRVACCARGQLRPRHAASAASSLLHFNSNRPCSKEDSNYQIVIFKDNLINKS